MLTALCLLLAGALTGQVASWVVGSSPQVGRWRSLAERQAYADAYQQALAAIPAPDAQQEVTTRYGQVHLMRWDGPESETPVLLLPGRSSGAPMWVENVPSWIGRRTLLLVDPIGDAGLSAQQVPLQTFEQQGDWILDLVTALDLPAVHVVGHSFGGATAAIFAVDHPDRVASLTLLEPVLVLRPMPAAVYGWAAISQLPLLPAAWRRHALSRIGGGEDTEDESALSRMIELASTGYLAAVPIPHELSDDQWRSLPVPVRLDVAGGRSLAGGEAAADRLRGLLPTAEVTVWPGTSHSLPMERPDEIGVALLQFWVAAD